MAKLLTVILRIWIHLHNKSGEIIVNLFGAENKYKVDKVTYIVEDAFDDTSDFDLCRRFISLIKNAKHVLTLEATEDTIDSENVSAVGKDQNEKDS